MNLISMDSTSYVEICLQELQSINEGLLLATSISNILFSIYKRGVAPMAPFFTFPTQHNSLNSSDLAVALLDIIGQIDINLEKLISSDHNLSQCYRVKSNDDPHSKESLEERACTILKGLFDHRIHDTISCAVSKENRKEPCMVENLEKASDSQKAKLLIEILEASWLTQFLISSLLGIQNSDIQKYETRRKHKVPQPTARSNNTSRGSRFSSTVLQVLSSNEDALKILFSVGLPRCLRLRTVFFLWSRSFYPHIMSFYEACLTPLTKRLQDDRILDQDLNVFTLSYLLSQLGTVILTEDASSCFVRYAALSGLHLLSALPHKFSTMLLLMGLQKAQVDGSFSRDTKKVFNKSLCMICQNQRPKRSPNQLSGSERSSLIMTLNSKKKHKGLFRITQTHCDFSLQRECSQCKSQWFFPTQSTASLRLRCPFCDEPTVSLSKEVNPNNVSWISFYDPNEKNSLLLLNISLPSLVHYEMDQIGSRVFCVARKVSQHLHLEKLDVMKYSIILSSDTSPIRISPGSLDHENRDSVNSWTLPAHGWLLRALDEASDSCVRQAALDLIVQILCNNSNDPDIAELRFKIHLPVLRSLFDPDPGVTRSAIECVVTASQLAPLKDGAVHRLIAFLTSSPCHTWGQVLFQLFERCRYHDASALKALVKGMAKVFYSRLVEHGNVRFPFQRFFIAIDKTLPEHNSNESNFFFYHFNSKENLDQVFNDVCLKILVLLKTCYTIGRCHFLQLIPFYDSQKCVLLESTAFHILEQNVDQEFIQLTSSRLDVLALICFMLGAGLQYSAQLELNQPCLLKNWVFLVYKEPPPEVSSSLYQWVKFFSYQPLDIDSARSE